MSKIHPKKSAENSHLLGSWQSAGLCYKLHRSKRRQFNELKNNGQLGEQLSYNHFSKMSSRRQAKKDVKIMTNSLQIEYNSEGLKLLEFGP